MPRLRAGKQKAQGMKSCGLVKLCKGAKRLLAPASQSLRPQKELGAAGREQGKAYLHHSPCPAAVERPRRTGATLESQLVGRVNQG